MSSSLRAAAGSFPHTRGTLRCRLYGAPGRRFIPAYAGNARWQGSHHRHRPVHPRMRGERSKKPRTFWRHFGSSPHTRGTRLSTFERISRLRFIPAYAGNATSGTRTARATTVHPRMRGERSHVSRQPCSISGSSPHARGTHHAIAHEAVVIRFIPACAGNAIPVQSGYGP